MIRKRANTSPCWCLFSWPIPSSLPIFALLQALFSKFGTVVATTVRRRRETGKDGEMKVSWALISFAEAREAKEAAAGAASLGCARRHRFLTCVCMLRICLERVVTKCLHISLRNLLPRAATRMSSRDRSIWNRRWPVRVRWPILQGVTRRRRSRANRQDPALDRPGHDDRSHGRCVG